MGLWAFTDLIILLLESGLVEQPRVTVPIRATKCCWKDIYKFPPCLLFNTSTYSFAFTWGVALLTVP